jgi:DNA (cytosine-5)-methyltransferase 1
MRFVLEANMRMYIEFSNDKIGIFIHRFGKEINISSVREGSSEIAVGVAISKISLNGYYGNCFIEFENPRKEKYNKRIKVIREIQMELYSTIELEKEIHVVPKSTLSLVYSNTDNNKKFKAIELFAGAGGLALGVEKAGFETIGLIEFDKDACDTLRKNRPNWNVICDDIANISKLDLEEYFNIKKGELDLLSGGAPCQAFSYAGKRLGLEDARGTLFYHYAIFLEKLQPKMFLFENVRGLLTHDRGKTYQTMLEIFENAGYDIQKQVLNAWDYGVAQKRERLITIGVRKDLKHKVRYIFPDKHDYKPVLRDILKDVPESVGVPYGENKRKLFELVPPGGYWRDIDQKLAKEYMKSCWEMEGGRTGILRRLSMDEPSLTVLTSPSQKQTERCHPLEARPFTVRENARCQSFPDDWEFCGKVMSQYKQVGNAVPVNLGYEVANKIREALESEEA